MKRGDHRDGSREKILDAAERAFADGGFDGASLRQIVAAAGVNLATVYYYFQSKEGLLAAVLQRRFEPLRQAHLEGLRQLESKAGGRPLPLEKILEAMLTPPLRLATGSTKAEQATRRLIGRVVNDPNPQTQRLLSRQHHEIREAYLAAIRRSAPHLSEPDLQWRFEFFWGALAFVLCNPVKIEILTGGVCNPSDQRAVMAQMLKVFGAGFRAPAVTPSRTEKNQRT